MEYYQKISFAISMCTSHIHPDLGQTNTHKMERAKEAQNLKVTILTFFASHVHVCMGLFFVETNKFSITGIGFENHFFLKRIPDNKQAPIYFQVELL